MKITARPALPADYGGVIAMNPTVYEGLDYLHTYYHIYQQSHSCHPFLAEADGKIVGYMVLMVMEGGQTLLSTAGRVDPSKNSKGIFGQMIQVALRTVLQRVPSVRYVLHTGINAKHSDKMDRAIAAGEAPERKLFNWNYLVFDNVIESLLSALNLGIDLNTPNAVTSLHHDDLRHVFSDATNIASLFPTGYVISYWNWCPLRVNHETIMHLVRSHYTVCTFRKNSKTRLQAVSFSYSNQVPAGIRVDISYNDVSTDVPLIRQHVIKHVTHLMKITPPGVKVSLMVHFPHRYDLEAVKVILRDAVGENAVTPVFHRQSAFLNEGAVMFFAKL